MYFHWQTGTHHQGDVTLSPWRLWSGARQWSREECIHQGEQDRDVSDRSWPRQSKGQWNWLWKCQFVYLNRSKSGFQQSKGWSICTLKNVILPCYFLEKPYNKIAETWSTLIYVVCFHWFMSLRGYGKSYFLFKLIN